LSVNAMDALTISTFVMGWHLWEKGVTSQYSPVNSSIQKFGPATHISVCVSSSRLATDLGAPDFSESTAWTLRCLLREWRVEIPRCLNAWELGADVEGGSQSRRGPKRPPLRPPRSDKEFETVVCVESAELDPLYSTMSAVLVLVAATVRGSFSMWLSL
jgi:hypothetical protein